jgi:hypothetical protein
MNFDGKAAATLFTSGRENEIADGSPVLRGQDVGDEQWGDDAHPFQGLIGAKGRQGGLSVELGWGGHGE